MELIDIAPLSTVCLMDSKPVPDPQPILETAFSFWSSKVLLTAVEMGVFTTLGDRNLAGSQLGEEIGIHPRGSLVPGDPKP